MNPRREELWPGLLSGSTLPVLLRYFLVLPGTSMNCEVLLGTLRYFQVLLAPRRRRVVVPPKKTKRQKEEEEGAKKDESKGEKSCGLGCYQVPPD